MRDLDDGGGACETFFNGRQGLSECELMSAHVLDSTVLRSGLMDGFCVVLFEVGDVFLFGEFGSPPTVGEDLEGLSFVRMPWLSDTLPSFV
jgi:hypothetical protein